MDEAKFIQTIQLLAEKHGVEAKIDFEQRGIEFKGEAEDEVALAIELDAILGEFLV